MVRASAAVVVLSCFYDTSPAQHLTPPKKGGEIEINGLQQTVEASR